MELIYKSSALYDLVNWLLYGRHHHARYRVVADLIPAGSSVVDLCCGTATLYHRFLRDKHVRYTGLDMSESFVDALNRRGGHGVLWDLRSDKPLPPADYIVIQGALYFFLPNPNPLIERMLAAANKEVIIAEAIRNLSDSALPVVSSLSKRLAGSAQGSESARFTEETLDQLFAGYPPESKRSFKIPGGRDKVYVLNKTGVPVAVP
jgi:SAM-dependent methyltransferase